MEKCKNNIKFSNLFIVLAFFCFAIIIYRVVYLATATEIDGLNIKAFADDRKIYEITLKEIHKKAEECLFIDDSISNIESARELGIVSLLFNRYNEQYNKEKVNTFEALDAFMQIL